MQNAAAVGGAIYAIGSALSISGSVFERRRMQNAIVASKRHQSCRGEVHYYLNCAFRQLAKVCDLVLHM